MRDIFHFASVVLFSVSEGKQVGGCGRRLLKGSDDFKKLLWDLEN